MEPELLEASRLIIIMPMIVDFLFLGLILSLAWKYKAIIWAIVMGVATLLGAIFGMLAYFRPRRVS